MFTKALLTAAVIAVASAGAASAGINYQKKETKTYTGWVAPGAYVSVTRKCTYPRNYHGLTGGGFYSSHTDVEIQGNYNSIVASGWAYPYHISEANIAHFKNDSPYYRYVSVQSRAYCGG